MSLSSPQTDIFIFSWNLLTATLKVLHMSDNKLTEIPKEIGKLVNLESVWIPSFLTLLLTILLTSICSSPLLFKYSSSCVTTRLSRFPLRWEK